MPESIRERLAWYLTEEWGQHLEKIEILRTWSRPYSAITLLAARAGSDVHRFIMKRITSHALNSSIIEESNQGALEYEVLCRLYHKFGAVENCFVPRPIAVLPECNLLLMEHVEGHLLADDMYLVHFFSSPTGFLHLRRNFYLSGRWLRSCFDFTGLRLTDITALQNLLILGHDRLRIIEECNDGRCPNGLGGSVRSFLDRLLCDLTNSQILVSGQHLDFGPWNILASSKGVTVLDFFGFCEGPLPVSILSMLVWLDSIKHGLPNSARRLTALRHEFLTGIGQLAEMPEPLVLFCEAVWRIMSLAGTIIVKGGHVFSRFERNANLKAQVKWLLNPPAKSLLWPR